MPNLTRFNAENYRKTRRYLQTMPAFDWMSGFQLRESDYGCVACAAIRSCEGADGSVTGRPRDLTRILGCSESEGHELWTHTGGSEGERYQGIGSEDVVAAIARLDAVAARYGVTPEPEPVAAPVGNHEAAFLESCRQVSREAVTHA